MVGATHADERWAESLLRAETDKDYSFCDALSFSIMERMGVREAISFDAHFRQYGKFVVL